MWNEDVRAVPVKMGRLLTVSQAGAVLDMSERTVRRLIATGALATARVGRRVFVTRSSVLALAGVGVGEPRGYETERWNVHNALPQHVAGFGGAKLGCCGGGSVRSCTLSGQTAIFAKRGGWYAIRGAGRVCPGIRHCLGAMHNRGTG